MLQMGDAGWCNSKSQKDVIAKAIIENFSKYDRKPSNVITNGRTCTSRYKKPSDKLTSCFSDWSPRSKCFSGSLMQSRTNVACTTGSHYMLGDSRPPSFPKSSTLRPRQSSLFHVPTSDDSLFSVSSNDLSPESTYENLQQPNYRQQGSSLPRFREDRFSASLRNKTGSDDGCYIDDEGCFLGGTRKVSDLCCDLESENRTPSPFRSVRGKQMQSSRGDLQFTDYCGKEIDKESFHGPTRDSQRRPTDCCRGNGGDSMFSSDPFSSNGEDSGFPTDSFRPFSADSSSFERQEDNSYFTSGCLRSNGKANGIPPDSFSCGRASPFASESCRPRVTSRPASPHISKPNGETSRFGLDDFELNGEDSRYSLDSVRQANGGSQFAANSFKSNGACCSFPRDTTKSVCEISQRSYDPCKLNGSSSNFSLESFALNGAGPSFSPDSFKSVEKSRNCCSDLFGPNGEDSRFSQSSTCIDRASNFSSNAYRPNGENSNFSSESLRSADRASNFHPSSFSLNGEGSNFPVDPCGTVSDKNSGALDCCVANDCCDLKEDWEDPRCLANICGMGLDEWFAVSPSLQKVVAELASSAVKKGGNVLQDLIRLKAANILPPDFDIPGEEKATAKGEGKNAEATASQLKLAAEKLVEHIVCRAAKLESAQKGKNVDLSECDCFLEDVVTKISSMICEATDKKKAPHASASESQRTSKASSRSSSKSSSGSSSNSSVNSSSNNSALKNQLQLLNIIGDALMKNRHALLNTDPNALESSPSMHCATMAFAARGQTWQNTNNSQGGNERTKDAETKSAASNTSSAATDDAAQEGAVAKTRTSVADKERQIRDTEVEGSEHNSEGEEEEEGEEEGTEDNHVTTEPGGKDVSSSGHVLAVNGSLAKVSSENLPPTTFLELPPKSGRRASVDDAIRRMLESCLEDCSKLADSSELRSFVMEVVYGLYSTVRTKLENILKQQVDDAPPGSISQPTEEILGKADLEIRELVLPTVIEHIVWLVRQDAKQRGGQVNRDAAKALAAEYIDTIVTNAVLKVETSGKTRRPFATTFVVTSNDAKVKRHIPHAMDHRN